MKININKIIKTFAAAACILLFSLVTGCTGVSEPPAVIQNTKAFELKGSIALPGSRTATSSFDFEDFNFDIYAYKYNLDTGTVDTSTKYLPTGYAGGASFIFNFSEAGVYQIYVMAKKTNVTFAQGNAIQTVSEEYTEPVVIELLFMYGEDGCGGDVNLPVFLDSQAAAQVKKLEVIWERARTLDAVYSFEGNKAVISLQNIQADTHYVHLNFTDEIGNVFYSCHELINVYPGLTTDTWYGEAPYLSEEGVFTLTGSLISAYGVQPLPSTKTMLFNYNFNDNGTDDFTEDDEHSYDYYLVDDVTGSLPATAFTTQTVQYDSYLKNFTFFDKDGNIYHMKPATVYNLGRLISNKEGWQSPALDELSINETYTRGFKVDLATNIAYSIYGTEGSCEIRQYLNLISSNGESTDNETMYPSGTDSVEISVFDVYNNKIYLLAQTGNFNTYKLYIFNVKQNLSGPNLEDCGRYQIDPRHALGLEQDAHLKGYITDVIYQDDYLYMLYSESPASDSPIGYTGHWESSSDLNVRSRGAVIRYSVITGSLEALGYTQNKITPALGYKLKAFSSSCEVLYDRDDHSKLFTITDAGRAKYPNVYFPGLPESEFYGPRKFLAVKPKKLVISDEGLFFYKGDDDYLRYKNVNRIVYVDLEDFAITEVLSPAGNISMTKNIGYIVKGSVGEEVYYYTESGGETGDMSYYIGILNGDNEN